MTVEGIMVATITRTFKIDKAKKKLGYRPKLSVREGIERGVKWYLGGGEGKERGSDPTLLKSSSHSRR